MNERIKRNERKEWGRRVQRTKEEEDGFASGENENRSRDGRACTTVPSLAHTTSPLCLRLAQAVLSCPLSRPFAARSLRGDISGTINN